MILAYLKIEERVYIVAFNKIEYGEINFSFPNMKIASSLEDILETNSLKGKVIQRDDVVFYKDFNFNKNIFGEVDIPNKPIQIGKVNKGGQGERIYHQKGHAITLSAHGGGVGSKTGLYKINEVVRKLSPKECARLQGFPESFIMPESVSEAQKQFGNSVSINTLQYIIKEIIKAIKKHEQTPKYRFSDSKEWIQ